MNILVVGSGGREHALVWKISKSPHATTIYCAPGNPGIAALAECVTIKAHDIPGLITFAKERSVDLTVVGPEQPLADGIVDRFGQEGKMIFGPSRGAAELEWSKIFAKRFMERHRIPTASYRIFSSRELGEARRFVQDAEHPVVIKADGLASGKGVVVCQTKEMSLQTLEEMLSKKKFASAGENVVVEECLVGEEASVFAVSDGKDYIALAAAQDHKRVFDNDLGKNTGGMGAYAPAPIVTPDILRQVKERIITPTLRGMASEGRPYKGCLYIGLMINQEGPNVVEYNSRFGDPETQAVLPLLKGDLVELMVASCQGRIAELARVPGAYASSGSAVCVVLASGGYPDEYETGLPINGLESLAEEPHLGIFHAGTQIRGGRLVTAGGRVLGVTAMLADGSLLEAIEEVYRAVEQISFSGMHFRRDIGRKAIIH